MTMSKPDKTSPSVTELTSALRRVFEIPIVRREVESTKWKFDQSCAALDTLEDTELAIVSFEESTFPTDLGLCYLYTFGILQAIYVQQDALKHLAESFQVTVDLPQSLTNIRQLRNDAIGHPTKGSKKGHKGNSYHQIARTSLAKNGFMMMSSFSESKQTKATFVKMGEVIAEQRSFVIEQLNLLCEELRGRVNSHRAKYRGSKITDAFHPTMPYMFAKVREGICEPSRSQFGATNLDILRRMLIKCEALMLKRGEGQMIEGLNNDLRYYIDKLNAFFSKIEQVDREAALCFVKYVEEKYEEAKRIAEQIDQDYANDL